MKKVNIVFMLFAMIALIGNVWAQKSDQVVFGSKHGLSYHAPAFAKTATATIDESFEGATLPDGWTVYNEDGDAYQWTPYTPTAHSGVQSMRVQYNTAGCNDWLVSPQFTVGSTDLLTFWAKSYSANYPEDFNVMISTATNAVADFTITAGAVTQQPLDWVKYSYDLTTIPGVSVGQQIYVAIQCTSVDAYYLFIDDFKVAPVPTTPEPILNYSSATFGPNLVGTPVPFTGFNITNNGGATLTFTGVTMSNPAFTTDFDINTALTADQSYDYSITYTPTAIGMDNGVMTISTNAGDVTVTLSGAGYGDDYYTESFETTFPPLGWGNTATSGTVAWTQGSYTFIGTKTAAYTSTAVDGNSAELTTTRLDLTAAGSKILSFWYAQTSNTALNNLDVMISVDGGDFYLLSNIASGSFWTPYTYDLTAINSDNVVVKFVGNKLGATTSTQVIDFVVTPPLYSGAEPPAATTLVAPLDGATGVVANGTTVSWNAALNADGYKLYVGESMTPVNPLDIGNVTTFTIPMTLYYSTTYYWQVIPYNAFGDALDCPVWSFTTMADPTLVAPVTEAFDVVPPANWVRSKGLLAEPTVFTGASTSWVADGMGNVGTTGSARLNIWSTSTKDWMVTPPINLGAKTNYQLEFDLGLTTYSGTTETTLGEDDKFAVLMSVDGVWSPLNVLQMWDATSVISPSGDHITIPLTGASGIVQFAFYGESTVSNADNNVYVDNFEVSEIATAPIFSINPTAWDFGDVYFGFPEEQEFVISNLGIGGLNVTSITLEGATEFTLEGVPSLPVVVNEMPVGFNVVCTTTVAGAVSANLVIVAEGETYTIPVEAVGGEAPIEPMYPPANLTASVIDQNNVHLFWSEPVAPSLDFEEGFEAGIPSTWTLVDADGDAYNWEIGISPSIPAHGGLQSVISASWDNVALTPDNWMITPQLTLTTSELSWWVAAQDPAWPADNYAVYISTTGNTPADFTTELFTEVLTTNEWEQRVVDLSSYVGQTVYIGFRHFNSTDNFEMKIDDIVVTNASETVKKIATFSNKAYKGLPIKTAGMSREQIEKAMDVYTSTPISVAKNTAKDVLGYNVYRNGVKINDDLIGTLAYDDLGLANGTYDYTVTAMYYGGESEYSNTASVNIQFVVYDVTFEDGVIPDDWTVINGDGGVRQWEVTSVNPHSGTKAARVMYETSTLANDDWLISPKLVIAAGVEDIFSLWLRTYNATYEDPWEIVLSTTTPDPASFTTVLASGEGYLATYEQQTFNLDEYDGQNVYVAIHYTGIYAWYLYVDDIDLPTVWGLDNDLKAVSVTGNTTPTQNSPANYTVTVKNVGLLTQDTYTVSLFQDGVTEPIATLPGTSVAAGDYASFEFEWTTTVAGDASLYAVVTSAVDQDLTNNTTGMLAVNVQAEGTVVVTVGNQAVMYKIPFNFYWKNSLVETIYYPEELNIGGGLTAIGLKNSFETDLPETPIKIWVGETDATDLSAGMIPAGELQLVYDGMANFPMGVNEITLPLIEPYMYGGGNLVVMYSRPMDAEYYSSSDFFFTTNTPNYPARTAQFYSDGTEYDPYAPPAVTATALMAATANTTFFFNTAGMGSLTGVVSDAVGTIEGAKVQFVGAVSSKLTNAAGVYNFPYVFVGDYQVTASKHGYYSTTQPATIVEDVVTTLDFTLVALPTVNVLGMVVGSDNIAVGLEGAEVEITGYDMYSGTTIANGTFTITNVYGGQDYAIKITRAGYVKYEGTFTTTDVALDLGIIILNEVAFPVGSVTAVDNTSSANVSWYRPGVGGSGTPQWIMWDDGVNANAIGTGGAADFDVAHRYSPENLEALEVGGMSVTKVVFWPDEAAASYTVKVWTGGDPSAPGALLAEQVVSNPVIGDWNEVVLETPVMIDDAQELWVGYNVNTTTGYPAGCDAGPQVEGFGNMMYYEGAWTTLSQLAPTLTYNWNIHTYVDNAKHNAGKIISLVSNNKPVVTNKVGNVHFGLASQEGKLYGTKHSSAKETPKAVVSYKIARGEAGDEANVANWTVLGTNTDPMDTTFTDNGWGGMAWGVYKYAVQAVYTNNNLAPFAFSNDLAKNMYVPVDVVVTCNANEIPVGAAVALVNVDGDANHIYTGVTGANGIAHFDAVWRGSYAYAVVLEGFTEVDGSTDIVNETNTINVNLTEIIVTPAGLDVVNQVGGNALLTWNNFVSTQYVFDDGTSENGWCMNPGNDAWLGAQFPVSDMGTIVSFEIYSQANAAGGSETITVDVFDASQSLVGTSEEFVPAAGDWITVSVPNVPFNGEFYAMCHWNMLAGSTNYIGYDQDGPNASAGYDWYYDGTDWLLLNEAAGSAPGCFLIRANVMIVGKLQKIDITKQVVNNNTKVVPNMFSQSKRATVAPAVKNNRSFVGYKVYLDNVLKTPTPITETSYTFTGLVDPSNHIAGVQAVYTSASSDIATHPFLYGEPVNVTVKVTLNSGESSLGAYVLLENADFMYEGYANNAGEVALLNVEKGSYALSATLEGYNDEATTVSVMEANQVINVTLTEIVVLPYSLAVDTVGLAQGQAMFSWNNAAPGFTEDFETGSLGDDWEIIQTNAGGGATVPAYWNITDFASTDIIPFGSYHAGLWWDYDHQDEWLITPEFGAAQNSVLTFETCVFYGSVNGDHYYIQVSTDGGSTWTPIWDASEQTGGWNYYNAPISVDLSAFAGQSIKVAFNAVDGDGAGLWYVWFVDNVQVGGKMLPASAFTHKSASDSPRTTSNTSIARDGNISTTMVPQNNYASRSFEGYKVYLNNTFVAQVDDATQYLFENLNTANNIAGVSALYTSGETEIVNLPFVVNPIAGYTVTFNVDMRYDAGFVAGTDLVYMSGILGWTEPGLDPNTQMHDADGDMIYTKSIILQAGTYEYKYFDNAGWSNGEWAGGANRTLTVAANMTVNDIWSFADNTPKYDVTFNVKFDGTAIPGAVVTLTGYAAQTTNATGVAVVAGVTPAENIAYTVSMAGYEVYAGTVSVSFSAVSVDVTLEPVLYPVTLTVKDKNSNAVVADATVKVSFLGQLLETLTTNAQGTVSGQLPSAEYTYTVTKTDYVDFSGSFTVAGAAVTAEALIEKVGIGGVVASNISMYPNPVNRTLYIDNVNGVQRIVVTNVIGKAVKTIDVINNNMIINVSELVNGIYFVNFYSNEGTVKSVKVIKN